MNFKDTISDMLARTIGAPDQIELDRRHKVMANHLLTEIAGKRGLFIVGFADGKDTQVAYSGPLALQLLAALVLIRGAAEIAARQPDADDSDIQAIGLVCAGLETLLGIEAMTTGFADVPESGKAN